MSIGNFLIDDIPWYYQKERLTETILGIIAPSSLFVIVEWTTFQITIGSFDGNITLLAFQQIVVMPIMWVGIMIIGFFVSFSVRLCADWCTKQT